MSAERDLLTGLKDDLVADGFTTRIVFGELPSSPAECVSLTVYAATDEPTVALTRYRVQAMIRGAANQSLSPGDIADDLFTRLQGLQDRTYGDVHLVQCFRVSAVPLGMDDLKRSSRADNYEIDADLPLTAGRPF